MNAIPKNEPIKITVKRILYQARTGTWNGIDLSDYFLNCKWFVEKYLMSLILSRDNYHHDSGWWKNPDYEQCWHLSLAFYHPNFESKNKDIKKTEEWLTYLFGEKKRMVWSEPPYSIPGKAQDIWHYRLFCNQNWQPIIPRGEVYSKEFTEVGWLSYSEMQSYHKNL